MAHLGRSLLALCAGVFLACGEGGGPSAAPPRRGRSSRGIFVGVHSGLGRATVPPEQPDIKVAKSKHARIRPIFASRLRTVCCLISVLPKHLGRPNLVLGVSECK